mgnify:CR=1 FL=1
MSDEKIQTAKGMCVIAMTKHIMEKYKLSQIDSFAKLASLEFYQIFLDTDAGLYLEPDFFLFAACDLEISGDKAGMYAFIQDT